MQAETDKQRILDMLEAEYEFVHRTIDNLSLEIMIEPNAEGIWSIKDTLAHLTAWMQRVIIWLGEIAEGQAPSRLAEDFELREDQLNEEQYQRDKDCLLEDVLADFHATYHEVYALIAAISEEDLFVSTFGGLVPEPIWYWVKYDTYHHFHHHIQSIRKWLAEKQKLGLK